MSSSTDSAVFRFHIDGGDGRRSCEWRIWTGRKNKYSDDTYLAPAKLGGELKVSLHKDGNCFHGLNASIRSKARTGDRHALDAWQLSSETIAGWQLGYRIRFPESQLEAGLTPANLISTAIPAPPRGQALVLTVLIGDKDAEPLTYESGLDGAARVVATLPRKSGGLVALVAIAQEFDPADLEEAVKLLNDGTGWSLPAPLSEHTFGWTKGVMDNGTRCVTEYCFQRYVTDEPLELPALPPFRGTVKTWKDSELPEVARTRSDVCGVLVCYPNMDAVLFVDNKARCNHSSLGDEAERLRLTRIYGRQDSAWTLFEGGRWATMLSTPALFHESVGNGLIPPDHEVAGFPTRRP